MEVTSPRQLRPVQSLSRTVTGYCRLNATGCNTILRRMRIHPLPQKPVSKLRRPGSEKEEERF